jgi:hypothetical protein
MFQTILFLIEPIPSMMHSTMSPFWKIKTIFFLKYFFIFTRNTLFTIYCLLNKEKTQKSKPTFKTNMREPFDQAGLVGKVCKYVFKD